MATIKAYTDIEQSRKLAEILPLESADMHYSKDFDGRWVVGLANYASVKIPKYVGNVEEHLLPCWSFAALFKLLPKSAQLEKGSVTELYRVTLPVELKTSDWYNNPVDAAFEIIYWLKSTDKL